MNRGDSAISVAEQATSAPAGIDRLIELADELRGLQTPDGSLEPSGVDRGRALLEEIADRIEREATVFPEGLSEAFRADADGWLRAPDLPPRFDRTRDATIAPADGEVTGFVGPVFLPNSGRRGSGFECVIVRRDEPASTPWLQAHYPHPHPSFQCMRTVAATEGLRSGNCVVLFPENVAAETPVERQHFAWFFFDKHYGRIYPRTLEVARETTRGTVFADGRALQSTTLDREETYQARCVWGYLHDYFHHTGPRPFDKNMELKLQWVPGMIEELKVDAQSAIAAYRDPDMPHGQAVFEFVVLERAFRYPLEPDAPQNSDAASGFALTSWLLDEGLVVGDGDGGHRLADAPAVVAGLERFVEAVQDIERHDDQAYLDGVDRLAFSLLRRPADDQQRYRPRPDDPWDRQW